MAKAETLIALDVGGARIGVAIADTDVKLAIPFAVVEVDGNEVESIAKLVLTQEASRLVVGYPRNQSGEATAQTATVEAFVARLEDLDVQIAYQDESLTSVLAEQRLKQRGGRYDKGDIDAEAAAIILQDYIESNIV